MVESNELRRHRHYPHWYQLLAVAMVLVAPMRWAHQALSKSDQHRTTAGRAESVVKSTPASTAEANNTVGVTENSAAIDLRIKLMIGSWEQEHYGRRQLTLMLDGKANMIIEPAGRWSLLFGKRIDIEMYWSVEGDRIIYGMTSGTPREKYALAVSSWGDKWNERLTKISETELIVTADDGSVSEWSRISDVNAER